MALLEVSDLSRSFDTEKAVDRVSFVVEQGEILCLLGPSGSGKTTLLRLVAGIEEPDEGTLSLNDEPLDRVPAQQRGFGLMFQDLALFPHMDTFGNVAFGLRMQRLPKAAVRERVHELLALVDMAGYAERKVHELSGGERQRVALARSLAPAPRLLMLDEPLGALDRALRDSLQGQVRAILKEVGVTSIYVTHDLDEAFAMADRLLFMNRGRIVQTGTPEEVYGAPGDEFVARSMGFKNIMPGVLRRRGEVAEIECAVGILTLAQQTAQPQAGGEVMLLIEEKGVSLGLANAGEAPERTTLSGTIVEKVFRGGEYELKVRVGRGVLFCAALLDRSSASLQPGHQVSLVVDPGAIKFLKSS